MMRVPVGVFLLFVVVLAGAGVGRGQDAEWEKLVAGLEKCPKKKVADCSQFPRLLAKAEKDSKVVVRLAESGGQRQMEAALRIMSRIGSDVGALRLLMDGKPEPVLLEAIGLAANTDRRELSPRILELAEAARRDDRERVLLKAVNALARLRHPEAAGFLLSLAGSDRLKVSRAALKAVAAVGGAEARKLLVKVANDGSLPLSNRRAAVQGLGHLKDPEATRIMLEMAADGDARLRGEFIAALGYTKDPAVVPQLVEIMRSREYDQQLVVALVGIRGVKASSMLMSIYRDEERTDRVRFLALCGAGRTGAADAFEPLHERVQATSGADRLAALEALGSLRRPEAVKTLYGIYRKAQGREKNVALWAIRNSAGKALDTDEQIEDFIKNREK